MIKTLAIITVVGFVLSVTCLLAAFALAGGPFTIDDNLRFHHSSWVDSQAAVTPRAA